MENLFAFSILNHLKSKRVELLVIIIIDSVIKFVFITNLEGNWNYWGIWSICDFVFLYRI